LTGTLVINGKHSSFTWQLKVSGLSSRVVTAQLSFGGRGKTGPLAMPICNKCAADTKGAYNGPYVANSQFLDALVHSRMYATVVTKLNPKGEIRGQLTAALA
jgi:hypothetical protein